MKNIFYLIVGLILCCSCSSTESCDDIVSENLESNVVEQQNQLSTVQLQIDSLNQSLFVNSGVQTRGLRSFFRKLYAVVVCDAVGAVVGFTYANSVGAVAGLVLASGVAAITPLKNIKLEATTRAEVNLPNNSSCLMPMNGPNISMASSIIPTNINNMQQMTQSDSIGYYHNSILLSLNNSLKATDLCVDSMIVKVAEATCEEFDEPVDSVINCLNSNRSLYTNIIDKKLSSVDEYGSVHEVMDEWRKLYPDKSEKLSVLESFLEGIYNLDIDENDGTYLNKILDIISESSLDPDVKSSLRDAFIVGNASYQLWNTEE